MSDGVVIEHDPDGPGGCAGCTFDRKTWCDAAEEPDDLKPPAHYRPAPAWCPLRSGQVTVRRPSTGEEGA